VVSDRPPALIALNPAAHGGRGTRGDSRQSGQVSSPTSSPAFVVGRSDGQWIPLYTRRKPGELRIFHRPPAAMAPPMRCSMALVKRAARPAASTKSRSGPSGWVQATICTNPCAHGFHGVPVLLDASPCGAAGRRSLRYGQRLDDQRCLLPRERVARSDGVAPNARFQRQRRRRGSACARRRTTLRDRVGRDQHVGRLAQPERECSHGWVNEPNEGRAEQPQTCPKTEWISGKASALPLRRA